MTAITQNLPWFISDLGTAIIGQKCYSSLVENLNIDDVDCLKYSLSKGLGLGIVVGGSIMKVPQLMLILSARSARGLSLPAYILETLSYAITTAYSHRNNFPFTTYGENLFLTLQNTLITFLIIYLPTSTLRKATDTAGKLAIAAAGTLASGVALYALPKETLALLQLGTLPLSLFSKLPQITQNARTRSTGQLSAFAVISQVVGCLARLFTTATEVGDIIVTAGFALALILNIVLGIQMWMYWGKDDKDVHSMTPIGIVSEKENWVQEAQHRVNVVVPPKSPMPPPRHATASPSGRKWARKVD
ncbi:mannose-P-dolichol utilization defect 1 protein [Gyrodon lividus]|nr:mannose-P-dolichol utilization defect 1 protein [Gyrodon lividus]